MHSFNNNKTLLLLNPKAGTRRLSNLKRQLVKFRNEFDYITISEIEDFSGFIKSKIDCYETFIAVGGDGTVNSVAANLINTDRILGVLPFGSGNGFAREMGFRRDIRSLLEDIKRKEYFGIDVLRINNSTCVNVAGVGIDSFVAHSFNKLKRRGLWNYGITILKTVKKLKSFYAAVIINDKVIEDQFYMVSIANTRQFGNNALLAPMALPDDGKFNLVLLKPFPKILLPGLVFQLLTGTLKESKYIRYIESGNPVTIRSEESRVHIDGEPVILKDAIYVSISRNALRILKSSYNKRIKTTN
jgi:YegS/Rv2252/BmrU family lipid kinase